MKENLMKRYLPNVDMKKMAKVLEIKEAYKSGDMTLKEARAALRQFVGSLQAYEIAFAEQEQTSFDEEECRKEDIQSMIDLFAEVMDLSRPALPEQHPIAAYYRENDEMRKLLLAIEDLVQYPMIKNQWLELYDALAHYRLHWVRKQNQLYSVLEKKGFDRPTTTMWLLDDFIRDKLKEARHLLDEDRDEEFLAMQPTIIADVRDLIQKEEAVLYPTALAMITEQEFGEMRDGDQEIGFSWVEVTKPEHIAEHSAVSSISTDFVSELSQLMGKYGFQTPGHPKQMLDVATGKLTLEQINLIYKHLPIDISFVDEQELVCFYSDTDHRIFPRSKNVIGRNVTNCHPRTSVHVVEEIIDKFRSGEQDCAEFWINKPDLFIYIYYVAVRDTEGRFRGVLEMMQDCTRIRALQDSRTLLTWSGDTAGGANPSAEQSKDEPQTTKVVSEYMEITPRTKLKDLLQVHPGLKEALPRIHSAFGMLHSPLGRIIISKADVAMMCERSGMPPEKLIPRLQDLISEWQG